MDIVETITARFDLTAADPVALPGIEGDWVQGLTMKKQFTQELLGSSILHFVTSGSEETGRGYLAVERITGTLRDGRSGSFTVHHGAMQTPESSGSFGNIVPGSGTGDFAHFSGAATIGHDADGAYFEIALLTS